MGNVGPRVPLDPNLNHSRSPQRITPSTQEDHRAKFYQRYHEDAAEYDKEFMEKYKGDLDTALIFVRLQTRIIDTY